MGAEPRQNTAEIQRQPPQVVRRRPRRKPTRLDHRTRVGKRARELSQHFTAAISASGRELSVELAVAIGKAAELVALAEDLRARMLRADPKANADDVVRMQRVADLAVKRLNLSAASSSKPALSLSQILAEHEGDAK